MPRPHTWDARWDVFPWQFCGTGHAAELNNVAADGGGRRGGAGRAAVGQSNAGDTGGGKAQL